MKDIFQRWAKLNSNEQCKRRCFCLSANKFCLTIEMCFTKKENYFITKWSIFDLIVARKLFYIAICFNLFIILFLFVYCSFYFRTTTVQCIQLTSLDVNKTALPQSFTKTKNKTKHSNPRFGNQPPVNGIVWMQWWRLRKSLHKLSSQNWFCVFHSK